MLLFLENAKKILLPLDTLTRRRLPPGHCRRVGIYYHAAFTGVKGFLAVQR